jgi:ribonucleoside-triphosphate reductase
MRSFILYRHTRKLQREHVDGLNDDTTYVDSSQTIEEYISQTDWRINANANTSYSNAGLVNNVAGKIIANYWLDKVYSKEEGYAHRNGDIHIHDLDCLTGYCAGWSLRVLLNDGFNGVRGRVESKPPSH